IPTSADPVSRGYAESLARPGHNVTGFVTMELSVISKMLQTLKEIAPDITHISMIYNPDNPVGALFIRSFESAAGQLGVEPTVTQIHSLADIERAVAAAAARPNGGIFRSAGRHYRCPCRAERCISCTTSLAGDLFRARVRI